MPIVVQTNVASLAAQKNLYKVSTAIAQSFNRLSSGYRINSAADDAAGLAISDGMQLQIRSFTVAERNAADGTSMAETADGALGELTGILGRMRELAMQSSNGSLQDNPDRTYLQTEFSKLQAEITRIQGATKFNAVALLATATSSLKFQIGITNQSYDQLAVTFGGLALTTLLAASSTVSSAGIAQKILDRVDAALVKVSTVRARYGAVINRLAVSVSNIQTARLNLSAANSRIRDVDVAEETSRLARNQVLQQAGAAVLAQSNELPALALSLLR